MFLTQEHSITGTSADRDLDVKIGSQESIWQNVVVFHEIENVLEDCPNHSYQAAFSIKKVCQKLVSHVLRYIPHR
ncbi:MAG: hypothetical protein LDL41_20865 [Coleofasciculus sp. S288]|nr:hypothetical protein [Coleofasciculus sp. S288]